MAEKTKPDSDFEKTLGELEKLIEKLEEGELSLDESLSSFKQGIALTRQCQSVLDNAQQTVEQLINSEGEESLLAFKPDA